MRDYAYLEKARAAQQAATRSRAEQRIEDVEELLGWGRSVRETAERAGFPSLAAAARYLQRHGRPDLARKFDLEYQRELRTRRQLANA